MKNSYTKTDFQYLVENSIVKAIDSILRREHDITHWSNRFIQPVVKSTVSEVIKGKDWNKMIDDLAKEKIRKLASIVDS